MHHGQGHGHEPGRRQGRRRRHQSCDTVIVKIYDPKMAVDKTQSLDDTGANWTNSTLSAHVGEKIYYKRRRQLDWQHRDQGHSDRRPLRTRRRCHGSLRLARPTPLNGDPLDKSVFPDTLDAAGAAERRPRTTTASHVLSAADLAVAGSDDFENKACITAKDTATNPVDVKDAAGETESCDTVIVKIYDPKMAVDKTQALDDTGANWTDSTLSAHVGEKIYYQVVASSTGNTEIKVTATDVPCGPAPVPRLYDSLADAVNGDPLDKSVFPDTLDAAGGANTSEDYYCTYTLSAADLAVAGSDDFENKACITAKDTATNPVDVKDAAGDTESCDTVIVKIYDPKMAVDKTQALDDTGANWTNRPVGARRREDLLPGRRQLDWQHRDQGHSDRRPLRTRRRCHGLYDSLADAVNGDPLASLSSRTRSTPLAERTRPRTTTASTFSAPPTWPLRARTTSRTRHASRPRTRRPTRSTSRTPPATPSPATP